MQAKQQALKMPKQVRQYPYFETEEWFGSEWHSFYKGKKGGFCQEIMKSGPMPQDIRNNRFYPMEKRG